MTDDPTGPRHYRDRPLEKLTDEELHLLLKLNEHSGLFALSMRDRLHTLAMLAIREEGDRELRRALAEEQ